MQGNGAYAGAGAYVAQNGTATLTLNRSTVRGNGSDYGGGIQNEGTLIATNSTFAENIASVEGGAISAPFNKPVTLRHCTVSLNFSEGIRAKPRCHQGLNRSGFFSWVVSDRVAYAAPSQSDPPA